MTTIHSAIEGFESFYFITPCGKVWSVRANRYLIPHADGCGYPFVALCDASRSLRVQPKVHVLVARAFIPNPNGLPQVNHIDGDKTNNAVSNLEWISRAANIRHAFDIGLASQVGSRNAYAKLTEADVMTIRKMSNQGIIQKTIAAKFGVTRSTVCRIAQGKSWHHVPTAKVAT